MNIWGIIGILAVFGEVVAAIGMGGSPGVFVNIPSLVIVVGFTLGAGLMAYGYQDLQAGLSALSALVVKRPDDSITRRHAQVLRGLIPTTYGSGVIGAVIGIVHLLAHMEDPSQIGAGMAVALLSIFYAAMLAEGVLRPGANYIEYKLSAAGSAADATP